jgi:hypothetical protein
MGYSAGFQVWCRIGKSLPLVGDTDVYTKTIQINENWSQLLIVIFPVLVGLFPCLDVHGLARWRWGDGFVRSPVYSHWVVLNCGGIMAQYRWGEDRAPYA